MQVLENIFSERRRLTATPEQTTEGRRPERERKRATDGWMELGSEKARKKSLEHRTQREREREFESCASERRARARGGKGGGKEERQGREEKEEMITLGGPELGLMSTQNQISH